MKKSSLAAAVLAALSFATTASATSSPSTCASIAQGTVLYAPTSYLHGTVIKKGRNAFGYDYNQRSFEGNIFNSYANADGFPPLKGNEADYLAANPSAATHWAWPYRDTRLDMVWSDEWLSNKDCNHDGLLDRHYGLPSYIDSGAVLSETESWPVMVGTKKKHAHDVLRVEARKSNSSVGAPVSYFGEQTIYGPGGEVLGPQLWGEFYVSCYKLNDPSDPIGGHILIGKCGEDDSEINDDGDNGNWHEGVDHHHDSPRGDLVRHGRNHDD